MNGAQGAHILVLGLKVHAPIAHSANCPPVSRSRHTPAVAFTGRSSQSFVVLVNGTVPCCQLAPRQPPLILFADITRLFFGMRRSERDQHRLRPSQKRGSPSLQHRSVLACHFCRVEAYDQDYRRSMPACETNFVEIVRIGADALLVLKVSG